MCVGEDASTRGKTLPKNRIHLPMSGRTGYRSVYRGETVGHEVASAAPFDGRNQFRREFRLTIGNPFEGKMPGTNPFVPLCHEGNKRIFADGHPPGGHRSSQSYLFVFFLRVNKVIASADFLTFFQCRFAHLFRQSLKHGHFFGHGKINQVFHRSHENFMLLLLTGGGEGVPIPEDIQRAVKINAQSTQCLVD
uniref:Uncharacterized protein n=1 Tax=Myoviridae sp. ct4yW2 TaxID=2827286 RepID=A0A8S5RAG9_9CAUD|nr:MAG TPA: hypothetical protein [Myoviridae sp. ct4yW2]